MRQTIATVIALASLGLANPVLAQTRSGDAGGYVYFDEPADVPAVPPSPPSPPRKKVLRPYEDRALDIVTEPVLTTFASDGEFTGYLKRLEAIKERREDLWALAGAQKGGGIVVAAATTQDVTECTDPELCPAEDAGATVVVTGTKATPPKSITNNQSAGVDEGDIVKQIGDYFLVLQDGRIFAVNIKSMQLTDRIDVYRKNDKGRPIGASWYDEMLVQDNNVLITAYSYHDSATELSVFRLDQATGKLTPRGVFLISSNDYYDVDNYATRIVGDRLVLYSPYDLEALKDRKGRPVIRRWQGPDERSQSQDKGVPLIDARKLYWPVIRTSEPAIHTVTICPLGEAGTRNLRCDTAGFVAPRRAQMFVSPENVYLWTSAMSEGDPWNLDPCSDDDHPAPRAAPKDTAPGVLYRLPIKGGEPALMPVRGGVFDQFSMDENKGRFRALSNWQNDHCEHDWDMPVEVALLDAPRTQFTDTYFESSGKEFRAIPSPGKRTVENRFIEDWLVYGGRDGWSGYPPDAEDGPQSAKAVMVPLGHPDKVQVLEPGHQFIRLERVGNDVMLSGYRDDSGLMVSLVKLEKTARLEGQAKLDGRYESESRSHAFNSTLGADGNGLMGIPTVTRTRQSGRWWWYSDVSDMSFLSFGASGQLGDLGAIAGTPKDKVETHKDYRCEVSCIDWYGNARPIFTENRVFALMATNLVEVDVRDGKVSERQRIDLTAPVLPQPPSK